MESGEPSASTIDCLQAARPAVDRHDAGRALARLESALFARERRPTIGRYTLERRLGSGGAGVVWLAHDPELDRRVAIKLLRTELFGDATRPEGRRQLIREARALAHLSHPNVVEVYAVERCDSGDPAAAIGEHEPDEHFDLVLVMEYIEGETLAHWLEHEARPIGEVIDVFTAAGRGLAAVHDIGLVHRDFKPANVVVGTDAHGDRRVKVLDFGLAGGTTRVVDPSGPGALSSIESEQAATFADSTKLGGGTPLFMAPEQHDGGAVDARTDQYAFCVSLWIALFGKPPFTGKHILEIARAKRFTPPRVPRDVQVPRSIVRILLRGLSVVPAQRWPSMHALLAALERARPRTRVAAVTTGALAAVALGWIAWPSASGCEPAEDELAGVWDDARRSSLRSELAARTDDATRAAEAVQSELEAYAGRWVDAWTSTCAGAAATAPTHAAVACLERARGELAAVVEALHLARAGGLEEARQAVASLPDVARCDGEAAEADLREPDDPEQAAAIAQVRARVTLASALSMAGDHEQAIATAREALDRARVLDWTPLTAMALLAVGNIETSRGEYAPAEQALRESYFTALEAGDDRIAMQGAGDLVFVVGYRLARHDEGREWARHAEARLDAPGVDAIDEAQLRNAMGAMAEDDNRLDDAAPQYERALALLEAHYGPDHPNVATMHNNLGNLAERRGRFADAEAAHRRALEIRLQALGEDDEMTAMSWNNLGIALHRQERSAEAEPYLRRALAVREATLGEDHPLVARTHMNLGVVLKQLDRLADAELHLRRAIAILEARLGPEHPDLGNGLVNLSNVLRRAHRPDEALAAVERARTIYESTLPGDHPSLARAAETEARIRDERAPAGGSR